MDAPRSLFPVLFAVFPCSLIWAADNQTEDGDFFDLSLEELLAITVDVSTGTKRSVKHSPASITLYTREEIQRMGVTNLDQLLNYVPGFHVSRTDNEGLASSPSIRGRRSNSVGREVLVLMDGARLNDPVTGGVFSQDKYITLENIKQVEIIRGPGSALYGANAFSAVINLITDHQTSMAQVRAGSLNAREGSVQWSEEFKSFEFSLFAREYEDDGHSYPAFYNFQGQFEPTQDPFHQSDIYLQGHFKGFSAYYREAKRTERDFINSGAQAITHQRNKTENQLMRVTYEHQWSDIRAFVHAEHSESDFDNTLGLFPEDPIPSQTGSPLYWSDGSTDLMIGGNVRTVEHDRVGMDLHWQVHSDHLLSMGVSWMKEENSLNPFQSNVNVDVLAATGQLIPTTGTPFLNRGFYISGVRFDLLEPGDRISKGAYLQDEWQVTDSLGITLGVRHDNYDDFGSHNSYRGGVVYSVQHHTFKLLYGEAFRAPSFLETGAGIASGGISNPDLTPEEVSTYEVSWNYHRDYLQSTLTFFHNHYDALVEQVLVSDVVPGFTAFQPQNTGEEDVNGVEVEVDASLTERFFVRTGYAHIFNTVEAEPVAENTAFIIANYHLHPMNYNLSGYYHDEVLSRSTVAEGDLYLDDYWIFNASLQAEVTEHLLLQMDIYNLTDENFKTWSPQEGLEQGLPSRGRTALVGLTIEW